MSGGIARRDLLAATGLLPLAANATATVESQIRSGMPVAACDVIDAHAHVQEVAAGALWPRGSVELIEDMDRCGIRAAVFSHLSAIMASTAAELRAAHDQSSEIVRRNKARLRAYIAFQPHLALDSRKELDRLLDPESGFAGIKLHGPIHRYPMNGTAYREVYRFAHEHSLPVLFHVYESGAEGVPVLARIAAEFPNMCVILAHLWPGSGPPPELLRASPNLYADTCASSAGRGQIASIVRNCGAERIVFATDATYLNTGGQLAKVGLADVAEERKRLVLGGNALRIFRGLPARASL
jgi:predicted TIM-barrel fold metal-dependent hydrolase